MWAHDSTTGLPSSFPTNYLFSFAATSDNTWRDPRVEYDPIHGRFWITIIDAKPQAHRFHVAVSRNDSPSTFDLVNGSAGDWYVYTGDGTGGAHGAAFDLGELADPFNGLPDHQVISVDDEHLWVVSRDLSFFDERGSVVSIPLVHGAGQSMLTGQRPSEAAFGVVHLSELPSPDEDFTLLHYAIQEPFDQFAGAQFTINLADQPDGEPAGFRNAIRLGASRWDSGTLVYEWKDLTIDAASDQYFVAASDKPRTPKSDWKISTFGGALGPLFDSGVLFKNANGDWRMLAGHHVGVVGPSKSQTAVTEFRWYLIDPDLDNFPGTTTNPWVPQIAEDGSSNQIIGRAPTGTVTDAHTYHGAVAVNDEDVAYITFTRSGTSGTNGWPSLVRARLTADYSGVQYEVAAAFEPGPRAWLPPDAITGDPSGSLGWAYADIQPAPDHCGFWAVGTLVADPGDHEEPVEHDERAIWVTEILACNSFAEMNGDGTVDAADLALFLDHYAKQTPQADMDGDRSVDSVDYLIYTDEYAKR